MAQISTKKERKPLATGSLSNGNLYFNYEYGFSDILGSHNKLGDALLDFAWFDENLLELMFGMLHTYYMQLKKHRDNYWFITSGLLDICKDYLKLNGYITVYLLSAIDFLMENSIDRRILTYESEIKRAYEVETYLKNDAGEVVDERKIGFLSVFRDCITTRQAIVEETLERILGDGNTDGGKAAMAKLCRLEQEDKVFKKHWHSRFESYIGKINEYAEKYAHLTVLDTIDDMMRYELVQMILRGVKYKRCQCCGKLFLPHGRADAIYCKRTMLGEDRPCSEIGANIVAVEKRNTYPELRIYRQAYERLYKRMEMSYMEQSAFAEWDKQAREKRDICHAGEMPLDEFVRWIDETSRQRKGGITLV